MYKSTVLYHANCADGFGSAWAAWKSLGDAARYLPVQHGQPPPLEATDCDYLFILDFSYPLETLRRLSCSVPNMVVIDHHKTAQETLDQFRWHRSGDPAREVVFDLSKSGAVLTWEYFHPRTFAPDLLTYVQDRDLWEWKLPGSREVNAALASYPFYFEGWDRLCCKLPALEVEGKSILRYQEQQVRTHANNSLLGKVGGYEVPVVNATTLMSEIGELLCREYPAAPFSATYFIRGTDGKRVWSLRSRGDFDVGALAESLGGGGHPQAAGFEEPVE